MNLPCWPQELEPPVAAVPGHGARADPRGVELDAAVRGRAGEAARAPNCKEIRRTIIWESG